MDNESDTLFDAGRAAYTDAPDGTWISSPDNIRRVLYPLRNGRWAFGLSGISREILACLSGFCGTIARNAHGRRE